MDSNTYYIIKRNKYKMDREEKPIKYIKRKLTDFLIQELTKPAEKIRLRPKTAKSVMGYKDRVYNHSVLPTTTT